MALINCLECNKEVSTNAGRCPNCGSPIKKPASEFQIVTVVMVGIVVVLVIVLNNPWYRTIYPHGGSSASSSGQSTSSYSKIPEFGELVTLKANYPIAASEALFNKAVDIIISKDVEAFAKLSATGLVTLSKEGAQVYYDGIGSNTGIAKIRLKGSTITLYTNVDALKR